MAPTREKDGIWARWEAELIGEGVREGVVGGSCVCIVGTEVRVGIGDKSGTVRLLDEGGGSSGKVRTRDVRREWYYRQSMVGFRTLRVRLPQCGAFALCD
jgi:hypothetical protein